MPPIEDLIRHERHLRDCFRRFTNFRRHHVVRRGLGQFNRDRGGLANDSKNLTFFIRDATGQKVGGLLGFTLGTWFHIEFLWLDERIRGRGHGRRLLHRAEEEARARGCHVVDLRTFDFRLHSFTRSKAT